MKQIEKQNKKKLMFNIDHKFDFGAVAAKLSACACAFTHSYSKK